MDLLRFERIVSTEPSPGLERHEPGREKMLRRKVERRDPENLDEEEEGSPDESEQHTFDTRA
jgi:hypothetical protein